MQRTLAPNGHPHYAPLHHETTNAPAANSGGRNGAVRERQPAASSACYWFSTLAKISGTTMVASDSMRYDGVSGASLPHVIFSFGTAPE